MRPQVALVIGLLAGGGCRYQRPAPPVMRDLSGVAEHRRTALLPERPIVGLYLYPAVDGVATEDRAVSVLEVVGALDDRGRLFITDLVHNRGHDPADVYGKLDYRAIMLSSAQGRIDPKTLRFTPHPDPLVALDTGYQVDVKVARHVEQVVLRPLYDADRYRPYRAPGRSPPAAAAGSSGPPSIRDSGLDGADGADGERGANPHGGNGARGDAAEKVGQPGGHGGDGGDGVDGVEGGKGGRGGHGGHGGSGRAGGGGGRGKGGARGGSGPALKIEIRPAYSKFYPDETLVFIQVDGGKVRRRYIVHPEQPFSIASVGGRGGAGGAGGRGGPGGRGGNGGDGGGGGDGGAGKYDANNLRGPGGAGGPGGNGGDGANGGRAGIGGDGGSGARGGDGGRVDVRFAGAPSPAFVRLVRRWIEVQSIGGEGGAAGAAGASGSRGGGGSAGKKGKGGKGGDSYQANQRGADGDDGKRGDSGDLGPPAARAAKAGRRGPPGASGSVLWGGY